MHIRECECDSNIVLSKFKFNCDEVDKTIPDPLPKNLNHFMLIVGKPGSSKTTLLMNLIAKRGKMYNKKYDRNRRRPLPCCCKSTTMYPGSRVLSGDQKFKKTLPRMQWGPHRCT